MDEGSSRSSSLLARLRIAALGAAVVVALAVAAAACGGDDDGDNATPTEEATATPEATEDGGASPSPTVDPAESPADMVLKEWVVQANRGRARPGTVTFTVRNEGELTHQFVVIRTDVEKDELPRLPNDAGADESQLDVVGKIDAIDPGATDELVVDVQEGAYVVICNLSPGGESHYLNGMYTELEITPTAPLDTATPGASP